MGKADRDPLFFPPSRFPEEVGAEPEEYSAESDPVAQHKRLRAVLWIIAVAALIYILAIRPGGIASAWRAIASAVSPWHAPARLSDSDRDWLSHRSPQREAELLLRASLAGTAGAADFLRQQAPALRGKLQLSNDLKQELALAFAASDPQVRRAGGDVNLALYGVEPNSASVDRLIEAAQPGHEDRANSIWLLGLLAADNVEAPLATQAIEVYLQDPDRSVRYSAVEATSFAAGDGAISGLVDVVLHDPDPGLRQAAAKALATGGLLTAAQRRSAVPRLLDALRQPEQAGDAIYLALRGISGANFPQNPTAWRDWYARSSAGQNDTAATN